MGKGNILGDAARRARSTAKTRNGERPAGKMQLLITDKARDNLKSRERPIALDYLSAIG